MVVVVVVVVIVVGKRGRDEEERGMVVHEFAQSRVDCIESLRPSIQIRLCQFRNFKTDPR